MSFGFGFALPHWQTLSGGFSPASLFASGEQGAWYDPSDLTTLFQDSAGTTPVTAVEQPVGLVLDKSKGLVLGSELVTNGDFSQGSTGWTAEVGWTISGGAASYSSPSTSNFSNLYQNLPVVVGRLYRFSLTVTNRSAAGRIAVRLGGLTFSPDITANGQFVCYFFAPSTGTLLAGVQHIAGGSAGTVTITIDDFSVRELPGNHAYQTTSASRPTLRARYNLLTYSEQFDNGAYNKMGTTVSGADINATTAPDGTVTADRVRNTATTGNHDVYASTSTIAATYTFSAYLKADGVSWACLAFQTPDGINRGCFFDLANGVLGTAFNSATGTISAVPNATGWYRCVVTATAPLAGTSYSLICVATANGSGRPSYLGDTSQTIFAWGAQLVPTAVFPSNTYQRIAAATDYATGAAFPVGLDADGVDDGLLTNSVDFSATDKVTVWAGVTKQSDASLGMLTELSATVGGNNGTFYLVAPSGGGANDYSFVSKGTSSVGVSGTAVSPITNVVTGIGNIGAPSVTIRLNGVQTATSSASQGTGNFGNYPLYIGRRNNASLPLNGNIYSLIIRGAQSTAAQISSTESWVAAKTPLGSL